MMPLPEGTRYRWKKFPSGKMVRLAFAPGSNKVIEAKSKKSVLEKKAKKKGMR
jgi:hypothetical protein